MQMFYEKSMSFLMAGPERSSWEEEWEQSRERQIMKSYFPGRAPRIQELAEQECDRMEYEGSRMYDVYPDKQMLEKICGRIRQQLEREGVQGENLRELIWVLLWGEMLRRRERRRKCQSFF